MSKTDLSGSAAVVPAHAWVERVGARIPVREVAPAGSFTLVSSEEGGAWCKAARDIAARRGIELVLDAAPAALA